MAKPRGRPRNDDDFLALEIQRVMRAFGCGWRGACRIIENGVAKVPLPSRPGIQRFTRGSPWKGQRFRTLEKRYERWLRREEERQKKLTAKIHFPD
jgi:hypothetical protein